MAGRSREKPIWSVHLELLSDEAFYYFRKERGPGGLPVGTAGKVVCCSLAASIRRWLLTG
jgi:adenylyl- and sulfurtransferase ThiI